MKYRIWIPCALTTAAFSSAALGHAGPRIYLDIENNKVETYDGPYPPPENSDGSVSANPADYSNYSISRVFPGAPPDETQTGGQPDANVLPLHWDDDPLNFSTQFPGLQVYEPGSVTAGTTFSYNIMGEVQWYSTTTKAFEPISTAFPTQTPFIAVSNDLGNFSLSSKGFVAGNLAFAYSGDPTDHQHLTFTIFTPEDYADGLEPEDAPAGVYALPLQLTSSAASTPSDTIYILFGDRGSNLTISQNDMQTEMQQAIGVANATLIGPPNLTWNNFGSGSDGVKWDSAQQNWNDGMAAYSDSAQVLFNDGNNSNYAVTLNSIVRPGSVAFSNSVGNYTVSGSGSIAGTGSLTKNGTGSLTLNTSNSYTGGTTVINGTLIAGVANAIPSNSSLTIGAEGEVKMASNIGTASFSSLTISAGGTFDIGNNRILINYGSGADPIASITNSIASGNAGGTWTGPGITSSAARNNPSIFGIGYAESADAGNPAHLASDQIEVMYTYLGDANLDGKVNALDFDALATHYGNSSASWTQGDFNGDGAVNTLDFNFLAMNFNQTLGLPAAVSSIGSVNVPEPVSLVFIASSSLVFLGGRKRRLAGIS